MRTTGPRARVRAEQAAVPESLRRDAVSEAVWHKAHEVKEAKKSVDVTLHGWRIRFIEREKNGDGAGDMYIWPPAGPDEGLNVDTSGGA